MITASPSMWRDLFDLRPSTLRLIVGLAVTALAALVSANALANGMVWDDPIVLDRQLLAFRSIRDVIFIPRNIPQYSPDYYRPLLAVTYLFDRAVGGGGPFMFHLSVMLFHVAATYLVYRVGLLLFADAAGSVLPAGLGAALFAVHPIHSESVAWGAGRSDVVACGFALAAVVAYWQTRWPPWQRACLAALLLFVALLAKETAIAVLLLLPAGDIILERQPGVPSRQTRSERRRRTGTASTGSRFLQYLPLAAVCGGYFLLRQAALGTVLGQSSPLDADALAKMVAAVGVYLGKLLLPVRQSAYISELPTGPIALVPISAALVAAAAVTALAWQRGERAVTFLILWIALTLAPSLAIVTKIPTAPIAERYLYIPSVGFCLLAGYGAALLLTTVRRQNVRAACIAAIALLLGAGAYATIRRNAVWRTNLRLWEDTAAKNTTDGLPMRSLANAYLESGDAAKAAELFQLALQRRNDLNGLFNIHNNLGTLAMQRKRLDEAEEHYHTALGINRQAPDCLYNLGLIALTRAVDADATRDVAGRREQAQRARQLFEQAAPLSPLDPDIAVGLGQTLSVLGDSSGARVQFERALQLGLAPSTEASVRKLLADLSRDASR